MKQKQVLEITYGGKKIKVKRSFWSTFLQRWFHINRNHKDRLFIRLFHDPAALLELYNAVNHSNYTNPDDLIITTMEDAVYLGMKNDCSFLIGNYLNLYEHQSTFNPNMPLRGFLYFASALQGYLAMNNINLYGESLVKIPTPNYIVFYNGMGVYEDQLELRLSDAFENSGGCMEFTAIMLNINLGHNKELMEQCRLLKEYATFIAQIRAYQMKGYSTEEAVEIACEYCIEHDVLKEFLLKNWNEVRMLILTEYDEKKHMAMEGRDGVHRGKGKKVIQLTIKKVKKGQDNKTIAEALETDEAYIQSIVDIIEKYSPDYDEEAIYKEYFQTH